MTDEWRQMDGRWLDSVRDICLPASIVTAAACVKSTALSSYHLRLLSAPISSQRQRNSKKKKKKIIIRHSAARRSSRGSQTNTGSKFNLSIAIFQTHLEGLDFTPKGIVGI